MSNLSVFGLGKLGLPLAALLASQGHRVFGFDKSTELIEKLKSKDYNYEETGLNELLQKASKNLHFVDSVETAVMESELGFVIVPTPSLPDGSFSNQFLIDLIQELGPAMRAKGNRFVVDIVSTVMPGASENVLIPEIKKTSGLDYPNQFGFAYNPEFIALGTVIKNMQHPDMQLLGCESEDDYNLVSSVLSTLAVNGAPISSMNIFEAEIVKLAVNNFVTMKISFINGIMDACANNASARIKTISDAIGLDSRIGRKYLSGGAPYGGPCFPRDTRALALYLESVGVDSSLARATASVNSSHAQELAKRIIEQLREGDSKVLLVGASYKPDTNVIDESPAVSIGSILESNGVEVEIWNPIQTLDVNKKRVLCGLEELKFAVATNDLIVLMRDLSDCTIEERMVISGVHNRFSVWPQD